MLHQVRKSYGKTLYTMHLCENMHLDIFKKWKDISEISKSIVLTY